MGASANFHRPQMNNYFDGPSEVDDNPLDDSDWKMGSEREADMMETMLKASKEYNSNSKNKSKFKLIASLNEIFQVLGTFWKLFFL